MKFNFHAVSKKDRLKKTLLLGIPAALIIGGLGSFVIMLAEQIGFNVIYYAGVLSVGYAVGTMVRKIGRGTTYEFLIIAGVLGFIATLIAMFLSLKLQGFPVTISTFFTNLFDLTQIMFGYSILEVVLSALVAVYSANTVLL